MSYRRDQRSAKAQAYRRLYHTARWRRIRAAQLVQEPLCRMCRDAGRITAATVCDHIDPKTKRTMDSFFAGPFQSLCKGCHDGPKQREERVGYSAQIGQDGWPCDPRHPANRHQSR